MAYLLTYDIMWFLFPVISKTSPEWIVKLGSGISWHLLQAHDFRWDVICTVSEIARPLGHHERGKSGGAVSGTCVTRTHLLLFQTKDHTSPDENKQLGTRVPSAKNIYQRENASEQRISQKQAGVHRAKEPFNKTGLRQSAKCCPAQRSNINVNWVAPLL